MKIINGIDITEKILVWSSVKKEIVKIRKKKKINFWFLIILLAKIGTHSHIKYEINPASELVKIVSKIFRILL